MKMFEVKYIGSFLGCLLLSLFNVYAQVKGLNSDTTNVVSNNGIINNAKMELIKKELNAPVQNNFLTEKDYVNAKNEWVKINQEVYNMFIHRPDLSYTEVEKLKNDTKSPARDKFLSEQEYSVAKEEWINNNKDVYFGIIDIAMQKHISKTAELKRATNAPELNEYNSVKQYQDAKEIWIAKNKSVYDHIVNKQIKK